MSSGSFAHITKIELDGLLITSNGLQMKIGQLRPLRTLLWRKLLWGPAIEKIESRMVFERASQFLAEQLRED